MAISVSNLSTPAINTNTDATSYLSASWTPPTSGLILVWVLSGKSNPPPSTSPTLSGNGLTWSLIDLQSQSCGFAARLVIYGANASGSSTGQTTIDVGSETQVGMQAVFLHCTGVDLSGGVGTPGSGGVIVAYGEGSAPLGATSQSVTMPSASHADNRQVAGFFHEGNEVTTPRTNWSELSDFSGGSPNRDLEVQWRSDTTETTASASWTTATGCIGNCVELKADVGAGGAAITDPFGMTGFFGG